MNKSNKSKNELYNKCTFTNKGTSIRFLSEVAMYFCEQENICDVLCQQIYSFQKKRSRVAIDEKYMWCQKKSFHSL